MKWAVAKTTLIWNRTETSNMNWALVLIKNIRIDFVTFSTWFCLIETFNYARKLVKRSLPIWIWHFFGFRFDFPNVEGIWSVQVWRTLSMKIACESATKLFEDSLSIATGRYTFPDGCWFAACGCDNHFVVPQKSALWVGDVCWLKMGNCVRGWVIVLTFPCSLHFQLSFISSPSSVVSQEIQNHHFDFQTSLRIVLSHRWLQSTRRAKVVIHSASSASAHASAQPSHWALRLLVTWSLPIWHFFSFYFDFPNVGGVRSAQMWRTLSMKIACENA